MKKLLFITAIVLISGVAIGQGDCVRHVLGQYSYNNHFVQKHRRSGFYQVKTKKAIAYDNCGNVVSFSRGDKIYTSHNGNFWKGTYMGKSGIWAQTIIDPDGSGPQTGTFVYVLMKDLRYAKKGKPNAHGKERTISISPEKPMQGDYLTLLSFFCLILLFNSRIRKNRKLQSAKLSSHRTRTTPRAPLCPVADRSPVRKTEPSVPPVTKPEPLVKKKVTTNYTPPWYNTSNESYYPSGTYFGYSPTPSTPKEETKPQSITWNHDAFMDSVFEGINKRREIENIEREIEEKKRSGKSTYLSDIEYLEDKVRRMQ